MKKLKLLLVANNLFKWDSWALKTNELKAWANKGGIDLTIELKETSYEDIPFVDYGYNGDPYDKGIIIGNNLFGIFPPWYDENVSKLATGHDIVAFIVHPKQWKGQKAAGWRYDHNLGPVELQVCSQNEFETYSPGDGKRYLKFFMYLKHELSHAFYEIAGVPDKTHEYYYAGDWYCEKAIAEIKWPKPNYASDDPVWWTNFLNLLTYLKSIMTTETKPPLKMDLLYPFCMAIQKHEGWYEGSRSWRNNNPGNIKYLGQAKTIGQDKNGFAIFENYQDGFNCLLNMVRRAATGLSKVYNPDDTIAQFFLKYAPPTDNNDSGRYAQVVANALGVSIDYKIKNLII